MPDDFAHGSHNEGTSLTLKLWLIHPPSRSSMESEGKREVSGNGESTSIRRRKRDFEARVKERVGAR